MKKIIVTALLSACTVFSSDAITIDSLFKKQIGLRSVTKFSLLSSGNANSYMIYPNISQSSDPTVWNDTKELFLNQTFIYSLSSKLDIITSFEGSYARKEFTDVRTSEFKHENVSSFNSLWIGATYTFDSIDELIPQVTLQTAVLKREQAAEETKNFYFQSHSLKASIKGYSDPAIYSLYVGYGHNNPRKFNFARVDFGDTYFFGGDLSIALSPKITLDIGAQQSFQTKQKIDAHTTSNLRSISTYSVGSTYSLGDNSAISFSVDLGGSSSAPDSLFGISLWKKF